MSGHPTFTTFLSFEQAKKGERILTRLNDWLAETGCHRALDAPVREQLGTMLVALRRATESEDESPLV